MPPKKDLYFSVQKPKEVETSKLVRKVRGKKEPLVFEKPEKMTVEEKKKIKTIKPKAKKEETPTKRKIEQYQSKLDKKQKENVKQLESLRKIQEMRRKQDEERFGKPVQLPAEFYKLLEAIAPEKIKKTDVPSVVMAKAEEAKKEAEKKKQEKEEADAEARRKSARFEELVSGVEELRKGQEKMSMDYIKKLLEEEQRKGFSEGMKSKEKGEKETGEELEKLGDIELDIEKGAPPPYEEVLKFEPTLEQKQLDEEMRKRNAAEFTKAKKDNAAKLQQEFRRVVDVSGVKFVKKPNFTAFANIPLNIQSDLLNSLEQTKDLNEFNAVLADLPKLYKNAEEERFKTIPELTDDEINKLTNQDVQKFLDDNDLTRVRDNDPNLKDPKNNKRFLKKFMEHKRKRALSGEGLKKLTNYRKMQKQKRVKNVHGGFLDKIVSAGKKVYETGKKAYETGKKVYEQGKDIYETGKKVYDVGKDVYDTGKKVYGSFRGGKLEGGIMSGAGVKKGRGRPKKMMEEKMELIHYKDMQPMKKGRGRPKKSVEGGNILKKAFSAGKKAYETGKKIYETGKDVYETGKKAYDIGKDVVDTGKKVYGSFRGGKLEGGMVSPFASIFGKDKEAELLAYHRAHKMQGGIMSGAGIKKGRGRPKKIQGGIMSGAGMDDMQGGILSAAGLKGGIMSGAGLDPAYNKGQSPYSLPLPKYDSGRATFQSYF